MVDFIRGTISTDRSNTIAVAGTAQVLAPFNNDRRGLFIQNTSDTEMWVNELGVAAAAAPSIRVTPGTLFQFPAVPGTAISVFCAAAAKTFTAREW